MKANRNDALQTRDRYELSVWDGAGSAAHHFAALVLRCIRDTVLEPLRRHRHRSFSLGRLAGGFAHFRHNVLDARGDQKIDAQ